MRRYGIPWVVGLLLVAALAGPVTAAEPTCPACGAELGAAKFTVTLESGKEKSYGCPRCAMMDSDLKGAKAVRATDFLSRKMVDARKAFYLAGTSYGECCPPFWLSFARMEDAERFAKGFGGNVLTFEQARKEVGRQGGVQP